jgi:hypothetical protein
MRRLLRSSLTKLIRWFLALYYVPSPLPPTAAAARQISYQSTGDSRRHLNMRCCRPRSRSATETCVLYMLPGAWLLVGRETEREREREREREKQREGERELIGRLVARRLLCTCQFSPALSLVSHETRKGNERERERESSTVASLDEIRHCNATLCCY